MITRMTEYLLVSPRACSEELIGALQEMGVMDITRSHKSIDSHSASLMEEAAAVKNEMAGTALKSAVAAEKSHISALKKEKEASLLWGAFDKGDLDTLEGEGLQLHFHRLTKKKFDPSIADRIPMEIISSDGPEVLFVVVGDNHGVAGEMPRPRSCAEIDTELDGAKSSLDSLEKELAALPGRKKELQAKYNGIVDTLEGYLALKGSEADDSIGEYVDIYEGFAPADKNWEIASALDALPLYWSCRPATDDKTPVKLRNNWFARQFEVLTGMYGLPVYNEFDPTPILGTFFLLFFSLCMGDAGYGILLVATSIFLGKKMPESGLGKLHSLIMLLGIGTFVIGLLLGTFFGVNLYEASFVPSTLKSIMIQGKTAIAGRTFDVQMIMAICIGIFHICLAMTVKAICYTRRYGFKKNINTWAWLLLILGALVTGGFALCGVLDNETTRLVLIVLGCVSALGIFIFNTPGRNPLLNIGSGMWETYNMATGLLGDVLSYIRLYALGLAGGMLGAAFNNLGGMVLGDGGNPVTWVFFILIVLIGHALNLAMSCLGAFVHPLRLSFVEYFKNSGYEGRGVVYKPLENKNKNK